MGGGNGVENEEADAMVGRLLAAVVDKLNDLFPAEEEDKEDEPSLDGLGDWKELLRPVNGGGEKDVEFREELSGIALRFVLGGDAGLSSAPQESSSHEAEAPVFIAVSAGVPTPLEALD